MRNRAIILWVSVTIIGVFLGFAIWGKHSSMKPPLPPLPPIQTVKVFALSNAPTTTVTAKWSTNVPASVKSFIAHAAKSQGQAINPANSRLGTHVQFKNSEQESAYRRLAQNTGGSAKLFLRADNSTPVQIKGYPLLKAVAGGGSPLDRAKHTALTFLDQNAALLLLDDPSTELKMIEAKTDRLGTTSVRYEQTYKGLEVWPAQLSVHMDQQGDVTMMDGAYVATPENVPTIPQISQSESARRAEAIVPDGTLAGGKQPTLVVYGPLDQPPRLAWKSEVVAGLQDDWIVVVDALNGSTLTAFNQCADDNVAGSGTDLLGQTRSLNVWQNGVNYYLLDASKAMFNPATGDGLIAILDATNQTLGCFVETF